MKGRGLGTFEKGGVEGEEWKSAPCLDWSRWKRGGCEGSLWRVSRRAQKTYLLSLLPTASTPQSRAWGSGGRSCPEGSADSGPLPLVSAVR